MQSNRQSRTYITPIKISDNERRVLIQLASGYHPDEWAAYYFRNLVASIKLDLKAVRRAY
jgi:hypothetical protein